MHKFFIIYISHELFKDPSYANFFMFITEVLIIVTLKICADAPRALYNNI